MSDGPSALEVEEDEECWMQLEDHRMLLTKAIDPSRIIPYLRQCKVLNSDDEEQIYNDPSLAIRRRKVGKKPFKQPPYIGLILFLVLVPDWRLSSRGASRHVTKDRYEGLCGVLGEFGVGLPSIISENNRQGAVTRFLHPCG